MNQLQTLSYGGGVQSTALLVLMAQGKIAPRIALFCNVGDDSEHPASLRYVRDIAVPYAAAHGIALHILDRVKRDGSVETLYGRVTREGSRSIDLPMRTEHGGFMRRSCTTHFKIGVITKWLKAHGATKEHPAVVSLGISLDEMHRARTNSTEPLQVLDYPLLRLRLDRADCRAIIRDAGLPVPPKSSCYFCPFANNQRWQDMREHEPDLFAKAAALEELVSSRMQRIQHGNALYLHNRLKPLAMATSANRQGRLFDDIEGGCESGYCLT